MNVSEQNEQIISGWMAQTACVLIRGLVSCFPHEPVEKMLVLLSAIMGQQIAAAYASDELRVHKVRAMCRDAFARGIREAPVPQYTDMRTAERMRETASIGSAPIKQ